MMSSLRRWIEDLVLSERARGRGYFVEPELERLVADHLEGRADHEARLWTLAMLELWHRRWIDAPVVAGGPPGDQRRPMRTTLTPS
jgi:asparagine synthase (glutamine-hydrolysing)